MEKATNTHTRDRSTRGGLHAANASWRSCSACARTCTACRRCPSTLWARRLSRDFSRSVRYTFPHTDCTCRCAFYSICYYKQLGYECASFAPSTSPDQSFLGSSSINGRAFQDQSAIGCAIFINSQKLEVAQARRVELGSFCSDILSRSRSALFTREVRAKRHSIALAQLRLKSTGQFFVVVGDTPVNVHPCICQSLNEPWCVLWICSGEYALVLEPATS
jgi:hypothetical protein